MGAYQDFLPSVVFKSMLAISPDGSSVAYIDDAFGQFNVVIQSLDGGEPRRLTRYIDSTVTSLAWYPDGGSILYAAHVKGTENEQLFKVDVSGGEPQMLTDSPDTEFDYGFGYPFAPDGQQLTYSSNDSSHADQEILIHDLVTGDVRRAYTGGRVFPGYWSPDSKWLTAIELGAGRSDHVIYLISADGGPVRRLTPEGSSAACYLGPWLPDGSGFLVISDVGRDFTELAVMDASTGELSWLDTPGWDVEQVAMSDNGQMLVWSINVDGESQLRARDLLTETDLAVPKMPPGTVSELTITPNGELVVVLMSTPTYPANIMVLNLSNGRLSRLTEAAPAGAEPADFVEPSLVRCPARDGSEIPAYVYRPKTSRGQVGVVMAIHGGPALQERSSYSNDGFFQYLVSLGLAVFAPNVRGSRGYGMRYQRLGYRDWGGGDLHDLKDAVEWLRRQNWVDAERIGLVGRSYGGFAVLSCVARLPEVEWAAAVAWCGPSNLVTFTRAQPPSWHSHVILTVGDPVADEELLLSRSPITFASHIRTPLLVIQGANDPRVPRHESDQIVARLRSSGVEVRYDVYADEGHWFGKRKNQISARSSAGEFLADHLLR